MGETQPSVRACGPCQKYKRRCDKAQPACGLCIKLNRACSYNDGRGQSETLRRRVEELETCVASRGSVTLQGGDVDGSLLRYQKFFIDSDLYTELNTLPSSLTIYTIPPSVLRELGSSQERREAVSTYFETIHPWMPIVSKQKWQRLLRVGSENAMRPDQALLLLAMKLIQHVPTDTIHAARSSLYTAVREFSTALEMAGVYSLYRLQSSVLTTLYEMGHGIFPPAYMSLGHSVTQAIALGLHDDEAPQMLEKPRNWVEWEERLRTWWAVRIIDRFIAVGGNNRPLFTEDPRPNSHLPADDDAWDRGELTSPERMLISFPHQLAASPFGRVAQAAHLLGQVIRHCNEQPADLREVEANIESLSKLANSFLELLTNENENVFHFRDAIAICFSCDSFAARPGQADNMTSLALLHAITENSRARLHQIIAKLMAFEEAVRPDDDRRQTATCPSPWACQPLYKSAALMLWLGSAAPPEESDSLLERSSRCKEDVKTLGKRWKIADAYQEALAKVEQELAA
ncbi:hypothetical protein S40288_08934, partial [Stachybotrys chartarum IBT 40288]